MSEKLNPESDNSVYPSKKKMLILVGGLIILLFLVVFLFTRPALSPVFNLSEKGTIGDAINGITAPIITLITAALLYFSFQAQLEANKRQLEANKTLKSQWEFDTYYRLYGEIERSYFEDWMTTVTTTGRGGKTSKDYIGWAYLEYFAENMEHYLSAEDDNDEGFIYGHLNAIEFLLEDIIILSNYVRESDVKQKHFFLHRIERFYHNRIEEPLSWVYNALPKEPRFEKSHSLYKMLSSVMKSLRENELKNDILGRK